MGSGGVMRVVVMMGFLIAVFGDCGFVVGG